TEKVGRMQIRHLADAVNVAAPPHPLAVRTGERHIEPDLGLRTERARGQVVPLVGVAPAVGEAQRRAGARLRAEERTVDARAVLHHLLALLLLLRDLFQVGGYDAPGLRAVTGVGPLGREVHLDAPGTHVALELVAAP